MSSKQTGLGLVELAFSFVVMVTIAVVLLSHTSLSYKTDMERRNRVFAHSKATSILDELQSYVNRSEDSSLDALTAFDDGTGFNPVLTITHEGGKLVAPDHPLSNNYQRADSWVWSRRISVRPFAGLTNRNVRYVTVKVFRLAPNERQRLVAEVSRVVNSTATYYPPAQVHDIYLLALENIPGWWVHMDAIKPFIKSMITDLEARNPGVKFRTHWITKASYGRNPLYTPYVNDKQDSLQKLKYVYTYPGRMPPGSASQFYYVPSNFTGRINLDGQVTNGYHATENPWPYSIADSWNHAMRLPAERELFAARVASGQEDPSTPTWRLLLEDMASNPAKYHNAILVNLHGELLPMPALRNYSDAAKASDVKIQARKELEGLRVVTHPEQLHFDRSSENVGLRVYAYRTDPNNPADSRTAGLPITIQIMNVNLAAHVNTQNSDETLSLHFIKGGIDGDDGYTYGRELSRAVKRDTGMFHQVEFVDNTSTGGEKYTLIKLFNTPSIAPSYNDAGLDASQRLYGLEYIPCFVGGAKLLATGARPKNTARWEIEIPKRVLGMAGTRMGDDDHMLEIRTRIDEDLSTGLMQPDDKDPENLSRTWTWWTASATSVPYTERYQVIGDPRHCPYKDLQDGGTFSNGYNWYFDDFKNGSTDRQAAWPGFSKTRLKDGWKSRIEIDYPRLAQLLRTSLTRSEAIYTTLTGFSYYYIGIGGEIGSDLANGYPYSIPCNLAPWGEPLAAGYVDNIATNGQPAHLFQKLVREAGSANYWWGMHWLGELYPNSQRVLWTGKGNLLAGDGAGEFYRTRRSSITRNLPAGTSLADSQRRTRNEGCTSVFNIGSTSSSFHHQFKDGQVGTLEGAGLELASNYNFPIPSVAGISRPFALNISGSVGDEWSFVTEFPRYNAKIEKTYYRHESGSEGSALVSLSDPTASRTARIIVNGLDRTIESGSAFIAKYALLSLLHSYFESGNSLTNPVNMLPRLQIVAPTEITEIIKPTSIDVKWSVEWRRWDGQKYTESYSDDFSQPETNLEYVVMYSNDGGKTFRYVQDDSLATPGTRPASPGHVINDTGTGNETYNWPTPATKFPEGSYLMRIEARRTNEAIHYSYHQSMIYLHR